MAYDSAHHDSAHHDSAQRAGLLRVYSRTVGIIQVLYALFFGWIAFATLRMVLQTEGTFKGVYFPAVDLVRLCEGAIPTLLFVLAFVAGCGLLALRSWARGWEIAYLLVVGVISAATAASEARRGQDVGYIGLFFILLSLPYLPFLFTSPLPRDERGVSDVTASASVPTDGICGGSDTEGPTSQGAAADPGCSL